MKIKNFQEFYEETTSATTTAGSVDVEPAKLNKEEEEEEKEESEE